MVTLLLAAMALTAVGFATVMIRTAIARGQLGLRPEGIVLGAVTNFFDTLGIGSFAPTTAWIKLRKLVPDSFIPAVLICGHGVPTIAQGLIFVSVVEVDPLLLLACIGAGVAGALVGAPIVLKMPVRAVQAVVGVALLLAAAAFTVTNLGLMPAGGTATALPPVLSVISVVVYFALGALSTAGIGFYAPSLAMFGLMGLNPAASFPIMAGAGAMMMPASGLKFLKSDRIELKLVLSLALGGIPAVLIAAWVVKSLPVAALRWLVTMVVLYTAIVMLRAAASADKASTAKG